MRRIPFVLLLCIASTGAYAQTTTPPWLWNSEDRIRERFDPHSKQTRREAGLKTARRVPTDATQIDGSTHPELFFPWELMDLLLHGVELEPATEGLRQSYRRQIEAAGWNYDVFWSELASISADYTATEQYMRDEMQKRRGNLAPNEQSRVGRRLCAARAEALQKARDRFGAIAFDRFLYTAVAPRHKAWVTDGRDAKTLLHVDNGCK